VRCQPLLVTLRVPPRQRQRSGSHSAIDGRPRTHLLDRTGDQVQDVFLRDLATIFPELPGLVTEMEVQRWPEGIPLSAPGRHRRQAVLERPVGRVHLAGDYLGARGGMDTPAVAGYEAAQRAMVALAR
jgi:protoporphyrinogen/coproporphyrinogen III oxidase